MKTFIWRLSVILLLPLALISFILEVLFRTVQWLFTGKPLTDWFYMMDKWGEYAKIDKN